MSRVQQVGLRSFLTGAPGRMLMNNGWDFRCLRPNASVVANALLRDDEWKAMDDTVVETAFRETGAMGDLRDFGLIRRLPNLGVLTDQYEAVSDVDPAEQEMSGVTPGQRDLADWELRSVPVPITFREFQLNLRYLQASRNGFGQLDTTNVDLCTRKVVEKLEDTLFLGSTVKIDNNTAFGYINHPDRITGSIGTAWTTDTTTVIADVIAMMQLAEANNFRGPYALYIPVGYMSELRDDYKAESERTFLQRILDMEPIELVRGTASLTGDNIVLVQLTRDVVDLAIAQEITVVQWADMGGFIENFKVMAGIVPRVKQPHSSQTFTGIVHFT